MRVGFRVCALSFRLQQSCVALDLNLIDFELPTLAEKKSWNYSKGWLELGFWLGCTSRPWDNALDALLKPINAEPSGQQGPGR